MRGLHARYRVDRSSERGVSTQVSYVLAIGVITILMAGLIYSTGGLVDSTTEQGTQAELQIIGDRIAAQVMTADRTIGTDTGATSLVLDANVPARAGGEQYSLNYTGSELVVQSSESETTVRIPLETDHDLEIATQYSTEWRIYTTGSDELRIGSPEDAGR